MADQCCRLVLDLENVIPGWACGRCHTYNSALRKLCRQCGHACEVDRTPAFEEIDRRFGGSS